MQRSCLQSPCWSCAEQMLRASPLHQQPHRVSTTSASTDHKTTHPWPGATYCAGCAMLWSQRSQAGLSRGSPLLRATRMHVWPGKNLCGVRKLSQPIAAPFWSPLWVYLSCFPWNKLKIQPAVCLWLNIRVYHCLWSKHTSPVAAQPHLWALGCLHSLLLLSPLQRVTPAASYFGLLSRTP